MNKWVTGLLAAIAILALTPIAFAIAPVIFSQIDGIQDHATTVCSPVFSAAVSLAPFLWIGAVVFALFGFVFLVMKRRTLALGSLALLIGVGLVGYPVDRADAQSTSCLLVDGSLAMTGDLDMGGHNILNIGEARFTDGTILPDDLGGGATTSPDRLSGLTDVTLSATSSGQILTMNQQWQNVTMSGDATINAAGVMTVASSTNLATDPADCTSGGSFVATGISATGDLTCTALATTSPVSLSGYTFGLTLNAGTDLGDDLEEENHNSEHHDGGADPIALEDLETSCAAGEVGESDGLGDVVCVANAGGGSGPIVVVKSADESVGSSTTLQNDDELLAALASSTRYAFRLMFFMDSNTTAGFKHDFAVPTGATGTVTTNLRPTTPTANTVRDIEADQTYTVSNTTERFLIIHGHVTTDTTAGNLQFRWAQNVSDAAAARVTEGSSLIVWTE